MAVKIDIRDRYAGISSLLKDQFAQLLYPEPLSIKGGFFPRGKKSALRVLRGLYSTESCLYSFVFDTSLEYLYLGEYKYL